MPSDSRLHLCTIIARNYLAGARVLARTFLEQHPEGTVHLFVTDEPSGPERSDPLLNPLRLHELKLGDDEYREMAAMYNVTELATAIKPWVLEAVLARSGAESVLFLDPDIAVFGALDAAAELARSTQIALTPHLLQPLPRDGLMPSELEILRAGTFNLGFIALSTAATPFLDWWKERLRRDCLVQPEIGLYVDQRWIDLAVHYFPHGIITDDTYNVAYWNIESRHLSSSDGRYFVNERPLTFFHFSGFRLEAADALTSYFGTSARPTVERGSALSALLNWYRAAIIEESEPVVPRYGWSTTAAGTLITDGDRRRFRAAVIAGDRPPDLFGGTSAAEHWLSESRRAEVRAKVVRRLRSVRDIAAPHLAPARRDGGSP